MAANISLRRRIAEEDICPLVYKCERSGIKWERKSVAASSPGDREEAKTPVSDDQIMAEEAVAMEIFESSEDELGRLDIDLDRKSKQHNLTSSNVRTILHEVITNEHVVAMMKATIRDTQDLPMFEPKMTRSRLKQAAQQGKLQSLSLSLSAETTATVKPPQFVDIDLEEEGDSSDEEYCPDDEEEDDTAEETFLSDADSLASPPKIPFSQPRLLADHLTDERKQSCPGHMREQVMNSTCTPEHLLTAPAESSFLERLNAVEEELDSSPTYTYSQSLNRKAADDDEDDEDKECSSGLAYRTRSKLRLVNVPLGQLEAELLAPDITADMYDQSTTQQEEDRHWTLWLQGLMDPDNEGQRSPDGVAVKVATLLDTMRNSSSWWESWLRRNSGRPVIRRSPPGDLKSDELFQEDADDDDDPEYNFLDDQDEPDMEDYRTDRAVQITKKEVNALLEELFDTLQESEVVTEEQDEAPSHTRPKFNIPQALRFDAPLASMLTERRRTVRKQYEALQQRRALQDTAGHYSHNMDLKDTASQQPSSVVLVMPSPVSSALHLDCTQKLQLQQQIQQHVQLLTQVHLLSHHVNALNHEACITKHYLEELQHFASRQEQVFLPSSFRVCNLQGALDLLQEVKQKEEPPPALPAPAASRRWLPTMAPATNSHAFPLLPTDSAWLFATRPIFLYPELLPVCSLDPALHTRHHRSVYTAGEDGLIVLGLKHFEGGVQPDQLISSYLLRKTRWNLRKRVQEMSSPRAPHNGIKMFVTQQVVPPLPLACSRVQWEDRLPPVERQTSIMPNWLKNNQNIILKTRQDACSPSYAPFLPRGCILRLHPCWLKRLSRPPATPHRRLFTLAHNASLLPICPAERQVDGQAETQVDGQEDNQPIQYIAAPGVTSLSDAPNVSGVTQLAQPPANRAVQLAAIHPVSAHSVCANITQSYLPIDQRKQHSISRQEETSSLPRLSSLSNSDTTNPIMPCSAEVGKPGYIILQMVLMPMAPSTANSQNALGEQLNGLISEGQRVVEKTSNRPRPQLEERGDDEASSVSTSTLSPISSCEEEDNWTKMGVISLNGVENGEAGDAQGGGQQETGGDGREAGQGGGERGEAGGAGEEDDDGGGGRGEDGGGERGEAGGAGEEDDGGRAGEEDIEKDRDEDPDRQGEEEEEEDFDDLTQDEDEEEVMSSASEESVLSVPELQETMKQLTWLASERRLCADRDSEEDHSPTSPGSQEEEDEEEEGPKGEESGEGRSSKLEGDEETPSCEGMPRGGGRCPGRGRGRSRPLRGLRRSRQERHSKDAAKMLLLYDQNILDKDPYRESKDVAFAQTYLNRVREALHDVPEKVEEFVSLLNEFERVTGGQDMVTMFRKLRCILGNRTDLLRDFAAFLYPDQALECGLFEEQQAFEHSRRFLRQLEISFGDNPSHYQKIIKALQAGPDLSPASIHELKAQMASLLKGHNHLQAEFWVFFDELRPPPARPGQFEEAQWPEEGGGGSDGVEGVSFGAGAGAIGGFEEVTLPEVEEEEEGHKIQPMTNRRQRRKMDAHRNYKECDWSDKEWHCLCHDVKIRRHRRKGCSRCDGNKSSGGISRALKTLDPLYAQISATLEEPCDKDMHLKGDNSPQPDQTIASWDGSFPLTDEKEDELDDEEEDEDEEEKGEKRARRDEALQPPSTTSITSYPPIISTSNSFSASSSRHSITSCSSISASVCTSSAPPRLGPPPDLPVCAKNISLTASGEKVILWTREADRVILTTCQQEGADQNTFQAISSLLGNKTPSEVSRRFRDLMHLFRTAARQASSEDEAPPTEVAANEEQH